MARVAHPRTADRGPRTGPERGGVGLPWRVAGEGTAPDPCRAGEPARIGRWVVVRVVALPDLVRLGTAGDTRTPRGRRRSDQRLRDPGRVVCAGPGQDRRCVPDAGGRAGRGVPAVP